MLYKYLFLFNSNWIISITDIQSRGSEPVNIDLPTSNKVTSYIIIWFGWTNYWLVNYISKEFTEENDIKNKDLIASKSNRIQEVKGTKNLRW